MQGIVSRFFKRSGRNGYPYGFIEAQGKSYYFTLGKGEAIGIGEKVLFQDSENEKGLLATQIERVTK